MKREDAGKFWSEFLKGLPTQRENLLETSVDDPDNSLEAILSLADGRNLIIALTSVRGRTSPCEAPTYLWVQSKYGILVVWVRDEKSFKYKKVYIDPDKIVSVEHCPIRRRNNDPITSGPR